MAFICGKLMSICPVPRKLLQRIKYARFSTETAVVAPQIPDSFRVLENNPRLHTKEHIGRFYTIPAEDKKKLFVTGSIPKTLEIQIKCFRECALIVRKPAIEIISYLNNINYSLPAVRFILYGKIGNGKTCTLMHLVHYAYVTQHLIVHIPWAPDWTKRPKEVVDSQTRPGRIDTPVNAALWLQHFKIQNYDLLQKLNIASSQTYTWSSREETSEGMPILDIIEHGLNRTGHASDCVAVLLKEIKHHTKAGNLKTMVIIDGVNSFWARVRGRLWCTVPKASEYTLVRAFMKLLSNDWTNAVIIASVDSSPVDRRVSNDVPTTPRALLGPEGFELLDPFVPVLVEYYTDKETEATIEYYKDRLWIQLEDARGEKGLKELKFLSGNHPRTLMELCDPL